MIIKTNDSLVQALAALGGNSHEVAETLRGLGIKGNHQCDSCPVAQYLKLKGYRYPFVESMRVVAFFSPHFGFRISISAPTPDPVMMFINRFDRGGNVYPDLEGIV